MEIPWGRWITWNTVGYHSQLHGHFTWASTAVIDGNFRGTTMYVRWRMMCRPHRKFQHHRVRNVRKTRQTVGIASSLFRARLCGVVGQMRRYELGRFLRRVRCTTAVFMYIIICSVLFLGKSISPSILTRTSLSCTYVAVLPFILANPSAEFSFGVAVK